MEWLEIKYPVGKAHIRLAAFLMANGYGEGKSTISNTFKIGSSYENYSYKDLPKEWLSPVNVDPFTKFLESNHYPGTEVFTVKDMKSCWNKALKHAQSIVISKCSCAESCTFGLEKAQHKKD